MSYTLLKGVDFYPLGDNILVKVSARPEQTQSGLYIPESAQEGQVIEGTVVAIGDGRVLENGTKLSVSHYITLNATVWFPKFNGTKITLDGVECYVVSERVLLGVSS